MSLILRLNKVIAHTLGCIVSDIPLLHTAGSLHAQVQAPFTNRQLESPAQYLLRLVFQRAAAPSFQRNTLKGNSLSHFLTPESN